MMTCDLRASDVLTRVTRPRPAITFSNTNVMVKRGDVSDRQCLIARQILYNVELPAERKRVK